MKYVLMFCTHSELHSMMAVLQRTTRCSYHAMSRVKLSSCLNILTFKLLFL